MLYRYARILDHCEPYLIATDLIASELNAAPLGVRVPTENRINPQHRRHAEFLQQLRLMDTLCFGPSSLEMPPWVFYDCAVMPGAVFGLGTRRADLEPWALEAMRVPANYDGLVPLSMFIAIPMLPGHDPLSRAPGTPPSTWLVYTLDSMNEVAPGIGPAGLLHLTLALGLRVFPIRTLYATTQWRNPKLAHYVELGPLELATAYTPAHTMPRTLTFRTPIDEERLASLLMRPATHPLAPPANVVVDVDDVANLRQIQRELESGVRYELVGAPEARGTYVQAPMVRTTAEGRR
ncbi:MAG TPA: hypothetical protein VF469_26835 [Kofleriaceae bacterium]